MSRTGLFYYITVSDENGFPIGKLHEAETVYEYILNTRINPYTGKFMFDNDEYIYMLNHC